MLYSPDKIQFSNPRGFIVLEGVNGAGKSTLQARLTKLIETQGVRVTTTFEPGATPHGKELRKILLSPHAVKVEPLSELLLFAADRHEHMAKVIAPAIRQRNIVLCDRFLYSTLAFQGYGRGLDRSIIENLNKLAVGEVLPDCVLLLDLPAHIGLARTKVRTASTIAGSQAQGASLPEDSFEHESLNFHQRLRDGFLEIARDRTEPFVVMDATQSADQVFSQASTVVQKLLAAHSGAL